MSRSSWKHLVVNMENFKKLNKNLKITSRNEVVPQILAGSKLSIYNGKRFINVFIDPLKVGYKFGEFTFTRKPCVHKEKKNKKK